MAKKAHVRNALERSLHMTKNDCVWVYNWIPFGNYFQNHSAESYRLSLLLDLLEEAISWNDVVLVDTYSTAYEALDVLCSIADEMDINPANYENYNDLYEAVKVGLEN